MSRTCIFLIDPQNDFIEPTGSLYVKGADADSDLMATVMHTNANKISDIYVSLDTHRRYHIGHPYYWVDSSWKNPTPFTQIRLSDVVSGKWKPFATTVSEAEDYLSKLEQLGHVHTIWPYHCLVGTKGHAVYQSFVDVLSRWEDLNGSQVIYIEKGQNSNTEMYSVISAEVPDPLDQKTQFNYSLCERLMSYDRVIIAGQALSHCVNYTVRDLIKYAKEKNCDMSRIVVVEDGCSAVPGFEKQAADFLEYVHQSGCHVKKAVDLF